MRAMESWMLVYLLNSMWQVPLVFFAAWSLARAVRRAGPGVEHGIWVGALLLQVLLPACSFSPAELAQALWQRLSWLHLLDAAGSHEQVTALAGAGHAHGVVLLPVHVLAAIATGYVCIVAYFAGRLAWGLWTAHRVLRGAQPAPSTGAMKESWERVCHLFEVYDAQAFTSNDLIGPVTVGMRRRFVLLPAGMQAAFSDADLNAALAHEFAHMRRRDFAKNLVYELVSLPAAYHPLLWLTRARISETREMICDAMAAEATSGPEQYARSLLRLASLLVQDAPVKPLHAIGIFDANTFERRLMNLTQKYVELKAMRRFAIVASCLVVGSATCASALVFRMKVAAPSWQGAGAIPDGGTTPKISAGVMAGNRISFVSPVYPPFAKKHKLQGSVVLRAIIGKDGSIESLQVISTTDGPAASMFNNSALDAVHQWVYKPYLLNGDPTEVETTITVNYSLQP